MFIQYIISLSRCPYARPSSMIFCDVKWATGWRSSYSTVWRSWRLKQPTSASESTRPESSMTSAFLIAVAIHASQIFFLNTKSFHSHYTAEQTYQQMPWPGSHPSPHKVPLLMSVEGDSPLLFTAGRSCINSATLSATFCTYSVFHCRVNMHYITAVHLCVVTDQAWWMLQSGFLRWVL